MQGEEILSRCKGLNTDGKHQEAIELLESVSQELAEHPYFCLRMGIALYELNREDEALPWLQKAKEKGLEEIDEMPGTYLPKKVSKWVERAERKAPQRKEKNTFERERREKRNKNPQSGNLAGFDSTDFWNDCEYALESYVGAQATDEMFAKAEEELGYQLPEFYKGLMRQHNGGLLVKNGFNNPLQRSWSVETFSVESMYGVDSAKCYSLCGERGNKFWIEKWGYPEIGVAICDTNSGGHDMIFLDYTDCGPKGEPCVVCVNQESNYEITYLADTFEEFVRGLIEIEEEEY